MEPVARVNPREKFQVETNDCFYQQIMDEGQAFEELDYNRLNPATGPIYIEGAMPGDILKIKIHSIDVKDKGVSMVIPKEGVLGKHVTKPIIKVIPVEDGWAKFMGVNIPIRPMIGVIGVAPKEEDGQWPTATPWKHGGNMDTSEIVAGSTLYFQVNQEGALLALGDCHAVMGDGEVCFTGLEIPATVVLEADIIRDKEIKWPLLESQDSTMVLASGENLDEAIYEATLQGVNTISKALDMDFEHAYLLSSLILDLKISQVVDPKKTVRAAIPKNIISTEKIIEAL